MKKFEKYGCGNHQLLPSYTTSTMLRKSVFLAREKCNTNCSGEMKNDLSFARLAKITRGTLIQPMPYKKIVANMFR
jgi:hypothetical protein